jgi:hypothetical protein
VLSKVKVVFSIFIEKQLYFFQYFSPRPFFPLASGITFNDQTDAANHDIFIAPELKRNI